MSAHQDVPDRRPLPGSERGPAPLVQAGSPVPGDTQIEVTVVLRRATDGRVGADPGDVAAVTGALESAGLSVVATDGPSRRLRVRGSVAALSATFGTELQQVTSTGPDGRTVSHRHRTGALSVPAAMDGPVLAVLGLDDRPQARSQFRLAAAASSTSTSYTAVQLGQIYAFPDDTDGTGQHVAIIELGGGFGPADLDQYFGGLGLPTPAVTAVAVDGATNVAGQDPQGADGEVLLDIEVIGALAPAATIPVYFAPNTDAGFLDAVSEAVHATPAPAAISISWGQSEDQWTAQARAAMDAAFADAVTLNIVVTAAAGDNGSADGATDGSAHADFPASSPNVLACGGTSLRASGSTIESETVWNDGSSGGATGGGVSDAFDRPSWQADAGVPGTGRGVPDVAGNADPQTGYQVVVDGSALVIGGTSAVAPLWAALIARLTEATGAALTDFTASLYAGIAAGQPVAGLRDVTQGSNGQYSAGPGWDACTGLGSPNGTALLARLRAAPPAPSG
jgi:kumamolisin